MRKLLLSMLLVPSLMAANFTESDKRHFENQCKDLMSDVMFTLAEKHPNPKIRKEFDPLNLALALTSPSTLLMLWSSIAEIADTSGERVSWDANIYSQQNYAHSSVDFKWSDDNRTLMIVSSKWRNNYFENEQHSTLRNCPIRVAVFRNIRVKPVEAINLGDEVVTDFPLYHKQTIPVTPLSTWIKFDRYTGRGDRNFLFPGIPVDADTMNPPFHGFFTWHEGNERNALEERFPGFLGLPEANNGTEWTRGPGIYHKNWEYADAKLEVRHTRRKVFENWKLVGNIDFDAEFFVYANLKRYNAPTFSYRTHSFSFNRCNLKVGSATDLNRWIADNGGRGLRALVTINKPWEQDIRFLSHINYSRTREKTFFDNIRPADFEPFEEPPSHAFTQ